MRPANRPPRAVNGAVWLVLLTAVCAGAANARQPAGEGVRVVPVEAAQRVDVFVDGRPFTAYLYADTLKTLKKPILYPVRTASGRLVTRGFPLDPRPGERADHPHQVGVWLNHGDVNGFDFWNNSDAVPPREAGRMGTIRHRAVRHVESGAGRGVLDVAMDWQKPDGAPLLREETRFVFHAEPDVRVIDRITTLTALREKVVFRDSKEGMMAIRVARALEQPWDEPDRFVGPGGAVSETPVVDNEGVTGRYLSSEGLAGPDVWGTRAAWTLLSGTVEGEPVVLALLDHPRNVGYPTHWMARGYGLFAANPLGRRVYSDGKEALDFTLEPGVSTTFRYRLLILSGRAATPGEVEARYRSFAAE